MTQNEIEWNRIVEQAYADRGSVEFKAMIAADENADLTAAESGFEAKSARWYTVALIGYEQLLENGI